MMDPKIVLLDEPIAGVNPSLAHHIFKKIREVAEKQNVTFLIIEHRLDISLEYSDHVFALLVARLLVKLSSETFLKLPIRFIAVKSVIYFRQVHTWPQMLAY